MKLIQKQTAFSKSDEVCLDQNGIFRVRKGVETSRIPFEQIDKIQLICDGYSAPHSKTVYRCIVRSNTTKLHFSNAYYMTSPPEMDEDYIRFVQQLHQSLPVDRKSIEFRQGSNLWFMIAILGMATTILGALLVVTLAIVGGADMSWNSVAKAGRLGVFALLANVVLVPLLKKGKAKPYAANDLPPKYLPVA